MATLYISEYQSLGNVGVFIQEFAGTKTQSKTVGQAAQEPNMGDQIVSITGSSSQSTAFGQYTLFVRVHTDSICSIAFGFDPTATTSNKRLAANQTEYFGVIPGQKLAVISNV